MKKIILIMASIYSIGALAQPTITPLDKMAIPPSLKHELEKRKAEEKAKGFYENENTYAKFLLGMSKEKAKKEIMTFKGYKDPYDGHLKGNISEIHLAFPFKFEAADDGHKLGYVGGGSYIKEKGHPEGWTGAKVFFENKDIGMCSYSYFNLKLSHGYAELPKETTDKVVNDKYSSVDVEGTSNTGFLYAVNWYTTDTMQILECANKTYDKEITNKVVALANKIDKEQV